MSRVFSSIITIRRMLSLMEQGLPFSLEYVSYDRSRRTGGKIKTIHEAVLMHADPTTTKNIDGRPLTHLEQLQQKAATRGQTSRDPNHQHWYTRNVRLCVNGQPTGVVKKIHPPLILKFNSLTVVP